MPPKVLLFGVLGADPSGAGVDECSAKRGFGVVGVCSSKALLGTGALCADVDATDMAICGSVVPETPRGRLAAERV